MIEQVIERWMTQGLVVQVFEVLTAIVLLRFRHPLVSVVGSLALAVALVAVPCPYEFGSGEVQSAVDCGRLSQA